MKLSSPNKGTTTVLDLTTTTSIALNGNSTIVDITVDTRGSHSNVFMAFASGEATVGDAPYVLQGNGSVYSFSVNTNDALTLYFGVDGAAFAAGDVLRIQEWEE
jgi:hypothetical protein